MSTIPCAARWAAAAGLLMLVNLPALTAEPNEPLEIDDAPLGEVLTLARAERVALERDAGGRSLRREAAALEHEATAARSLPDPTLILGFNNVPTDTFDLDQDPMTQTQIGIRQSLPWGGERRLRQQRLQARAAVEGTRADDHVLALRREVRQAYVAVVYASRALELLRHSRQAFDELVTSTQREFAAGRVSRQAVIRARLERERLEDRISRFRSEADTARAALTRWVGPDHGQRPIDPDFPALPTPAGDGAGASHPVMASESARIRARQEALRLARQEYRPDLGLEFRYGRRDTTLPDGSSSPDLVSLMFTIDIPLFGNGRNDARLAAEQERLNSAHYRRDDTWRQLNEHAASWGARHRRLSERMVRYHEHLLPQAKAEAEAAQAAWAAGTADFIEVIRARLADLDTRLEALRIESNREQARAELLYLEGETS